MEVGRVELPGRDGCGWQCAWSRGGVNGKVLQNVSEMAEL